MKGHKQADGSGSIGAAALTALLVLAGAAAPAAAEDAGGTAAGEEPRSRPSEVELEGISLGVPAAELAWTLEGKGFRPSAKRQRRYIDDTGDVKKRVRYRELPNAEGVPIVWELELTTWHTSADFDPKAMEAELIQRYGEPDQSREKRFGYQQMVYEEHPDAPKLADVATACQAEVQKANPEMPEEEAEQQAYHACSYKPANEEVEKLCPGVLPLYRRFAKALEAPRMTIAIRSGRVDTSLTWPGLEADLIRKLGREKATRVAAGLDPVPEEFFEKGAEADSD